LVGEDQPARPIDDEAARHWSFQPGRRVPLPEVIRRDWPATAIDQFILAALEARAIEPAASADKRTLLRRATFDLTGLPPTPEEIQSFLADDSPEAFARVVDRLLASPAYGERWGRHWLDVVRYADARDLIQLPAESDIREVWRYRDWVVREFNRDAPYNEFIARQIAGDLLQPADPHQIDADALVATGMLALADFVPGDVDKEQMIADYVNDQIDVLGRAVLGLTLGCARCHDHKYDPISIDDYYSLAGIFFSTRLIPGPVKGNTPLVRVPLLAPAEVARIETEAANDKRRLEELPREISRLENEEVESIYEKRITGETADLLLAVWDYLHRPPGTLPTVAEFFESRDLDKAAFDKWMEWLKEDPPHPALADFKATNDRAQAQREVSSLQTKLTAAAEAHRGQEFHAEEMLRFRADDRKIATNEAGRVVLWPDLAGGARDAAVQDATGPLLTQAMIGERSLPVLRFQGQEILEAIEQSPATGSLFLVVRVDPGGAAGQRIIGWEDSSTGQHGIGLMPVGAGGIHAIARKSGANGDVVASTSKASEFQLISLTWGGQGVSLFLDGEHVGTNKGVDALSCDPTITRLRIGGPGSGSSPRFQGDLCELRVFKSPLDDGARQRVEGELRRRWLTPSESTATADAVNDLYDELFSERSPYWADEDQLVQRISKRFDARLAELNAELRSLREKPAIEIPRAVVVQECGPPDTKHAGFQDARVYLRGNPANPGKTVRRGFPRVLAGDSQPAIENGSGRRELAAWITGASHPLTARVMVNRIWQHHFGEGLVRTSTNFGLRGERPTHPELLDYLAGEFVASGWSIKATHRQMMLSRVYQQSSNASEASLRSDPENRWLGRMPRRRLEAEEIRDSLLAVAGQLEKSIGGPGFLEATVPRRSLYLMSVRTGAKAAAFCPLFDGPDGGGIIERRNESIVAPQALYLLNDPQVNDLSRALATRVRRENPEGSVEQQIEQLYELVLGRPPVPSEIDVGRHLLGDSADDEAWSRYCLVILCTNELVYVD